MNNIAVGVVLALCLSAAGCGGAERAGHDAGGGMADAAGDGGLGPDAAPDDAPGGDAGGPDATPTDDGGPPPDAFVVLCGDGVLGPGEDCDPAIAVGMPGACPTACDDGLACTTDALVGSAAACDARCSTTDVTSCTAGDGCCPAGCTMASDADCACAPRTACAARECGALDDGCGGRLDCGLCAIGGPCDADADCMSATCVDETESGWPGGICTLGCRVDADCGAGAHCAFRDPGTGAGSCVANCSTVADCRTGYGCRDADMDASATRECAPTGTGTGAIGAACRSTADCAGGDVAFCVVEAQGWQGGYCTRSCRADTDCVGASHCGLVDMASGRGVCLAACSGGAGCRTPGYACFDPDTDGRNECAPAATGTTPVGEACRATFECVGGTDGFCVTAPEFVGGYCTVLDCALDADCPGGSHCTRFGSDPTGFCAANCASDANCRSPGYSCFDVNADGRRECYPGGTGSGDVGSPCAFTWQCAGAGRARCLDEASDFRNGYCTLTGCMPGGAGATGCPTGSHCYAPPGGTAFCVEDCAADVDCRADGYRCHDSTFDSDSLRECFPAGTGSGAVGAACAGSWECGGGALGLCVRAQPDGSWPGGYCTRACSATSPCPAGSGCFTASMAGDQYCFDECTGAGMGDCRAGYTCTAAGGASNICL